LESVVELGKTRSFKLNNVYAYLPQGNYGGKERIIEIKIKESDSCLELGEIIAH